MRRAEALQSLRLKFRVVLQAYDLNNYDKDIEACMISHFHVGFLIAAYTVVRLWYTPKLDFAPAGPILCDTLASPVPWRSPIPNLIGWLAAG